MTTAELERFGERLRALRIQLGGEIAELQDEALRPIGGQASGDLSGVPLHPADLASEAQAEDLTLDLLENEGRALAEIDAALARIGQGTFGVCPECGEPIARARLEAIPYARQCIRCARASEGPGPG